MFTKQKLEFPQAGGEEGCINNQSVNIVSSGEETP